MFAIYITVEDYSYCGSEAVGIFSTIDEAIEVAYKRVKKETEAFGGGYYVVAYIFDERGKMIESISSMDIEGWLWGTLLL